MAVQAILFKRKAFTLKECKTILDLKKIKYLSYRTTDTYYRFRLIEPNYDKYKYRIERNWGNAKSIDYIVQI